MAYPILAPQNTWWVPTNSSVTKASITEIEIKDSYTPDTSVTVLDSWDASEAKDGSITCYVIGTKLIMAGNGSGKIAMNENSSRVFYSFNSVVEIKNAHLFDTHSVTNFMQAFYFPDGTNNHLPAKLQNIDVSTWDVSNCTNLSYMFAGQNKLSVIDVSNWNVSNAGAFQLMFAYCESVEELDVSKWQINPSKTPGGPYFMALFTHCKKLKKLDLRNWPLKMAELNGFFKGLESIEEILFSEDWLVGKTSAASMFEDCSQLKTLNTTDWDTSTVEDMSFMFYGCSSLKEIDVSKWDVSKVKTFDHFAAHANLRRKGIENWKTTSATNMNAMFHNCAEEELDLSGFDTSKVQFFSQMFENSPNLKRIKGLNKWDTSSGVGFDEMFGRCPKLEELDLSNWDTSKAKNGVQASTNGHTTGTFRNFCNDCVNLKWIKLGPNFSINGDNTNTTAEYKLVLPTPSTDYIEGADGNWYTIVGNAYAPNAVKDKTAETYYASYNIVSDLDVIVKNGSLIDTAKAIREKNSSTNRYSVSQFGDAIRNLNTAE